MLSPTYSVAACALGRSYGGFTNPFVFFNGTAQMLFFSGDHTVAGVTVLAATPSGHYPPSAWQPAITAGSLASRREVVGTGEILPFPLVSGRAIEAAVAGAGDLAAVGDLIVSLVAALSGSGTLTAEAEAFLQLAAELAGSGDLAGTLGALAHAAAALAGAGDAAATIRALGTLEAALVVTGTGLSTANVGEAVWAYLVESGYSAAEAQRILLAAAAGLTSGAGTSEMVFRDLADTKDRITGTLDGSGNRTAITLDAS